MTLAVGDRVIWNWGNGTASGTIVERFHSDVTRTIKGTDVTRKASDESPAFAIEQDDGDRVLKSCSEINPA